MNIEQIAREAGDDCDSTQQRDKDFLAKFAALYRAAVVQELVAGSGEPCGRINEWTPVFTRDQLAGAVARERERVAKLCEDEAWRLKKIAVDTQSGATNSKAIGAFDCAAAIRSGK